jgi:hypothetical protein
MAKVRAKDIAEGRHQFTEREFEPYALAIGQFCLARNVLHERLGELFILFCTARRAQPRGSKARMDATVDEENSLAVHAAIWHSGHYDRSKRDMLRALIERLQVTKVSEFGGRDSRFIESHRCA